MPERAGKLAGRSARPGSRFWSDVLAANIRVLRLSCGLEQSDVAERMTFLGHRWTQQTISEVERGRRNVTVDELLGLALILDATTDELLDPTSRGREWRGLDYGPAVLEATEAQAWVRGDDRNWLQWPERTIMRRPRHAPPNVGVVTGVDMITPPGEAP
jgi:transcriptional regulator with XRE-family HTH domain